MNENIVDEIALDCLLIAILDWMLDNFGGFWEDRGFKWEWKGTSIVLSWFQGFLSFLSPHIRQT